MSQSCGGDYGTHKKTKHYIYSDLFLISGHIRRPTYELFRKLLPISNNIIKHHVRPSKLQRCIQRTISSRTPSHTAARSFQRETIYIRDMSDRQWHLHQLPHFRGLD